MWLACQRASCEPREPMRRRAISSATPRLPLTALGFLSRPRPPSWLRAIQRACAQGRSRWSPRGFPRRGLQRGDGRVHDFVDDAAGQRFDRQFLLGGERAQAVRARGQSQPGARSQDAPAGTQWWAPHRAFAGATGISRLRAARWLRRGRLRTVRSAMCDDTTCCRSSMS